MMMEERPRIVLAGSVPAENDGAGRPGTLTAGEPGGRQPDPDAPGTGVHLKYQDPPCSG